jgi:hypothetical protein
MAASPSRNSRSRRPATKLTPTPVADVTRHIPWPQRLLLTARAGGRCEFDGCNDYLFEHPVTLREANFAQLAHIVAFSSRGPRGKAKARPRRIHSLDNLMLLCPKCHKEIDDRPGDFTVEALKRQKADHEARIRFLTDMRPDRKTAVVQFKAIVRRQMVDIPNADIATAVAPRYPTSKAGYLIDLTDVDADGEHFVQAAKDCIDRRLSLYYVQGSEVDQARHVSLFAIGPIPLLAYLGSRMSDKIQVDMYQRHRDTGSWSWKQEGPVTEYATRVARAGTDPASVALVISLSGTIDLGNLPPSVDGRFTVYEITTDGAQPGTDILGRRDSLEAFRSEYRRLLARIGREQPACAEIQVFAAVPAPVAVAIGLDRLRKVQPTLAIYSNEGPGKGFVKTLTIDDDDAK